MACRETESLLGPFVDGELSPAEREAVSEHVDGCLACQAELAALRATRERVAGLPRVPAPPALAGAVAARLAPAAPALEVAHLGEKLSAYLDGELTERQRAEAGDHLAKCVECARALASLDEVSGRVRMLPRASAPPTLAGSVIERIFAPRRKRPAAEPIQLPPGLRRFLAAASIAILALGSFAFTTPNVSSVPLRGIPEVRMALAPPPVITVTEEPRKATHPDPERTVRAFYDDPGPPSEALALLAPAAGFSVADAGKDSYDLVGSAEALRTITTVFTLEDQAAFDALVSPPLDHVTTRSRECFAGTVREEPGRVVVTATSSANDLANPDAFGPGEGLRTEYFALDGTPPDVDSAFRSVQGRAALLTTVEPTVDVTTPGCLPGARPFAAARQENVAIRFTGYFAARKTGFYTFSLGSDDGGRLEVDHRAVCGWDGNHAYGESQGGLVLVRGLHPVTVLYFNGGGPGACRLSVAEPGGPVSTVPQRLLHEPTRIERERSALSVAIPRRSVLSVEHASNAPVAIRLQIGRRGD
jgi:anti-sigma factor RsiW